MVSNLLVVVVFCVLLPSFAFSLPRLKRASEASASERDRQIVDELSRATGLTVDELHAFRRAREEASLAASPKVAYTAPAFQASLQNEPLNLPPIDGPPSILDVNRDFLVYLIEGDILPTKGDIEHMTQSRNKRGAPLNKPRWDKTKPIPYFFDEGYPDSYAALVEKAMKILSNNSCLSFERNEAKDTGLAKAVLQMWAITRVKTTVYLEINIFNGGGCSSVVGKDGRVQKLSLGSDCQTLITAAHELLHALGFDHEQSRYDRDDYITVNFNAINESYTDQFKMRTAKENDNYGVSYDYGSMMQYTANAFAKTDVGGYTMVPKDMQFLNTMGQEEFVAFTDLKQLNFMYSCADACVPRRFCLNGGFQNSRDCRSCICPVFFTGRSCGEMITPRAVTESEKNVVVWSTQQDDHTHEMFIEGREYYNFDAFSKSEPTIIAGPEGSRLKLTIFVGVNTTSVSPICKDPCHHDGVELVDGVDWTLGGKRFCCTQSKNTIHTMETRSNSVGVRAWSAPGWPIRVTISVDVISSPATTQTTTPSSWTTTPTETVIQTTSISTTTTAKVDTAKEFVKLFVIKKSYFLTISFISFVYDARNKFKYCRRTEKKDYHTFPTQPV